MEIDIETDMRSVSALQRNSLCAKIIRMALPDREDRAVTEHEREGDIPWSENTSRKREEKHHGFISGISGSETCR